MGRWRGGADEGKIEGRAASGTAPIAPPTVTPLLAAILAYLVVQLAIGAWVSRRIRTEDDYLVAGRRLGPVLATASIFATWFGAETIVGAAGRTATEGLSFASAEPFGYALCLVLLGVVFAVPLWRRGLTTLADLYRLRFSPLAERVAAVVLIPSSVLWAAAQVRAFGHVLTSASALPLEATIAIAAGFVVLYSIFGGLLADAITDLLQAVMLAVGLGVLFGAVVMRAGGPAEAAATIAGSGRLHFGLPPGSGFLATLEAWAIPVCGSVLAAEVVSRVIAVRSPSVARWSPIAGGALYLVVGLLPVLVGLLAADVAATLPDAEQLLPTLARDILPLAGYALFAGALVSAILSTVDSTLLVAAGLLSHNLLVPLLGATDERSRVRLARLGVAGFGLAAYVLARRAEGVFALVEEASAFGSAGALVTIAFGLFTPFGGPRTAVATLAIGVASYLLGSFGGFAYPFLLSLAASLTTYVVGGALGMLRVRREAVVVE